MDMRMPVMDGYQASIIIRQQANSDSVKIIAITASAFKEQHSRMINAGCDSVIHKPFHAQEIFTTLAKVLGVKFVYDDTVIIPPPVLEITTDNLNKLPLTLQEQLREAALNLDIEETEAVIAQIRNLAPELAKSLENMVQHFQFEQIIRLIKM
jgi:CheY-like chemotaxis protein